MDSQTTIQELKDAVKKFCEDRDWNQYHNAKDLAIGIITESSELLEHFRFKSQDQIKEMLEKPDKKMEISEEMADILYFLLRLAQMNNIDLSIEFEKKMKKNDLKYPASKTRGSNKKYNGI